MSPISTNLSADAQIAPIPQVGPNPQILRFSNPHIRLLLIRLREIGDVVFTTPAVRALGQRFPDAHISYLVEPAAAPVVTGHPHIHDVIVAPRAKGLRALWTDMTLGRRLHAMAYDVAIDFHGGPRASLLTWLSGAPVRIGYDIAGRAWMYTTRVARPRELRARHSVVNQWDLLAPLGIGPPDPDTCPVEMPIDPDTARLVADRLVRRGCRRARGERCPPPRRHHVGAFRSRRGRTRDGRRPDPARSR